MNKSKLSELNLTEARGWVIDRLNQIDFTIKWIIKDYIQVSKEKEYFLDTIILNSSNISFWAKVNILTQICKNTGFNTGFLKRLREMGRIRNWFAHSILTGQINIIIDPDTKEAISAEHYDSLEIMQSDWSVKVVRYNECLKDFHEANKFTVDELIKLGEFIKWNHY